ncbi:MAG: maleylacetoacetate isomerase [Sphingomonadales bacterium]|nr:maleylacetoacetate isomerase [Sphingomonadales bacterium]
MRLYTYFRSSAAYRLRIALNLKGIDWQPVSVNLAAGEQRGSDYLAVNVQGLVPALEIEGGETLAQSVALLEYLEETHPEPPLLPAGAVDRARVRAMVGLIACDIHPLNNLRILKYLKDPLGADQEAVDIWYRRWIARGFEALEQLVAQYGTPDGYCFGETVTLADVLLVPQVYNARRFETDLTPYPRLVEVDARLQALDAFADAVPEVQPDAPK